MRTSPNRLILRLPIHRCPLAAWVASHSVRDGLGAGCPARSNQGADGTDGSAATAARLCWEPVAVPTLPSPLRLLAAIANLQATTPVVVRMSIQMIPVGARKALVHPAGRTVVAANPANAHRMDQSDLLKWWS